MNLLALGFSRISDYVGLFGAFLRLDVLMKPLARGFLRKDFPVTKKMPIVLVPGLAELKEDSFYLAWKLRKLGWEVYLWEHGRQFDNINMSVSNLKEFVSNLGNKGVYLVGHSLGGVIALDCALRLNASGSVSVPQVVSLGSPFGGSAWSVLSDIPFFGSMALYQLTPEGNYLTDLKKRFKESKNLKLDSVYSEYDSFVDSKSARVFEGFGGVETHRLNVLGHVKMLYSDNVVQLVNDILSRSVKNG